MKHKLVQSALIAVALLLASGSSLAVEAKPGAGAEAKATSGVKATDNSAKAKAAKTAPRIKLVDINSASKVELKTLPGINDEYADKIIAGRPYLSKAHLVTRKIISAGPYQLIQKKIIAKQDQAPASKSGRK